MFSMTKLREKSHILLWILLFFFVLGMTVSGLVGGADIMGLIFGGRDIQRNVGSVGGTNITHRRFLNEREIQLNRMRLQGQEINSRAYQNASDFAWNAIIERELKDQKIKSLGLEVSLDEIYDFLLNTPPPTFQKNLMDAGYFASDDDKFDTESYQETVLSGVMPVDLNPLLMRWETYLRNYLADRKLQTIYNQLVSISDEDVKRKYMKDSLSCTLNYIYLPLSSLEDSLIEVSDTEISARYEDDKDDLYSLKERCIMEYVLFEVPLPVTSEDSLEMVAVEDSVMQLARDFAAEADYDSFAKALEEFALSKIDTIDVHETFEANSGIPFQMGVLRPAVRFAFDNSIGSISEPITAQNGIAVFHSLGEKSSGFKPLDDVRESIRRTLIRENKKEYAKNLLQPGKNNADRWEALADSDPLFQYNTGETQKIGGSFPGIGRNNELTGTLLAMEADEVSGILETYNAVLILHITEKDEVDETLYQEAYSRIRDNLLSVEQGRGYTSWLTDARKSIKQEDYRSEVY